MGVTAGAGPDDCDPAARLLSSPIAELICVDGGLGGHAARAVERGRGLEGLQRADGDFLHVSHLLPGFGGVGTFHIGEPTARPLIQRAESLYALKIRAT